MKQLQIIILSLLAILLCLQPVMAEDLNIGDKAPEFKLDDVFNQDGLSLADLEGRIVVIEFWATWCGGCKKAMPHMKTMYTKYRPKNVAFFTISVDENRDFLQDYIDKNDLKYTVGWDPMGTTAAKYGISHLPTAFIVDPEGKLAWKGMATDHEALAAGLQKTIAAFPATLKKQDSPKDVIKRATELSRSRHGLCRYESLHLLKALLEKTDVPCSDCARKPSCNCKWQAKADVTMQKVHKSLHEDEEAKADYDNYHQKYVKARLLWNQLKDREANGPTAQKALLKMKGLLQEIVDDRPKSEHSRKATDILKLAKKK